MGEDGLGDLDGKSFEELYQYYRTMYSQVTEDSVAEWEKKYPGSSMEKEDLKEFYERSKGNMKKVKDYIPFVEDEDLYRVKEVIDSMIESGELEVSSTHPLSANPRPFSADFDCRHTTKILCCLR
jgi:DnaJ homolog subfamily C member 9